jgi:hypothetical protein
MGWENMRIGQRTQRHVHGILCFALKITRAGYLLSRIPTDWSSWRGGTHIGPLYDPSGARTQGVDYEIPGIRSCFNKGSLAQFGQYFWRRLLSCRKVTVDTHG